MSSGDNMNSGLNIVLENDELLISGSKEDLTELIDYINKIALSDKDIDHIHLDDITLINENSSIKSLIIEKK